MNKLRQQLRSMGFSMGTDIFGYIVICNKTGREWKFPTLRGVRQFIAQ